MCVGESEGDALSSCVSVGVGADTATDSREQSTCTTAAWQEGEKGRDETSEMFCPSPVDDILLMERGAGGRSTV